MLTYSLADRGNDTLYQYLYECIKKDILDGTLAAGEHLPSKRSFAKNLGVSIITVENAYAQLQAEGYIYSLPKKGFYVTALTEPHTVRPDGIPDAPASKFRAASAKNKLSPTGGKITGNETPVRIPGSPQEEYLADFISNQMNPDNFPFSVWAKLIRETILNRHEELMVRPPCAGVKELRQAICFHLKQFRGMNVMPEQVIIGAGTEYLYGLLIQLLGYDKIYAVENPGYHKIARIYESCHVSCCPVPLDSTGISISSLETSGADITHISPSHHFPTGIVTSIARRYELLGWAARKSHRYIIEDDYDSEFRLTGKPIAALQSIDVLGKVIYMNTFTKSLSSTIRISYMVLPQPLLEQFYERLGFYSCTVSNFEQYTLAAFITEGYFEKHINRMRNHYRCVRDELLSEIKRSPLSSLCRISEKDAGLHFLLHVNTDVTDTELIRRTEQAGLRISCLSQYYSRGTDEIPQHTLVLNYSGIRRERIPRIVKQLEKCILPREADL